MNARNNDKSNSGKSKYTIYVFEPSNSNLTSRITTSRKHSLEKYFENESILSKKFSSNHKKIRSSNISADRLKDYRDNRKNLVITTENIVGKHRSVASITKQNNTEVLHDKPKIRLRFLHKPEMNQFISDSEKSFESQTYKKTFNYSPTSKRSLYVRPKVSVELKNLESQIEAFKLTEKNTLPPINLDKSPYFDKLERSYSSKKSNHRKVTSLTPRDTQKIHTLSANPSHVAITQPKNPSKSRSRSSAPSDRKKHPARFLAIKEIENQMGYTKETQHKVKTTVEMDLKLIKENAENDLMQDLEREKLTREYADKMKKYSILKSVKEMGES